LTSFGCLQRGQPRTTNQGKAGKGIHRKVSSQVKVPTNFKDFLNDSSNKQQLSAFLTSKISSSDFPTDQIIIVTSGMIVIITALTFAKWLLVGSSVISASSCQTTNPAIQSCDREEADSRIAIYLYNAMKNGG